MDKPGKNLSDVPEEDLNQHDSFSPAIAENGLIRPAPLQPADHSDMVNFLPDPTFTRLDTVQDLVQERKAARQAKLADAPKQENAPKPQLPADAAADGNTSKPSKNTQKRFWKRLLGKKRKTRSARPEPLPASDLPADASASGSASAAPVPQAEPEPRTVQLSDVDTLTLENPLTQMRVTGEAPVQPLSQPDLPPEETSPTVPPIGTPEDGTMTVSLDDVAAHPFTEISLTEALPPTLLSAKEPEISTPQADTPPQLEPSPALDLPADASASESASAAPTPQTPPQSAVQAEPVTALTVLPPPATHALVPQPQEVPAVVPSSPQPPQTPPGNPQKPARRKRRWPWVLLAVLLVFFGIIGGVVPVENIPILRNIAHAMGFTPDEAKQMSFLRALLTWTDKTLGLNGKLSAGPGARGESALFSGRLGRSADGTDADAEEDASFQGRMTRYGGKTSLFDMQALNELQRQKGRLPDQIAGTVLLQPGQKADTRAAMRDTDVTVRTEANRDKSEVYFGSDASATNREFYDGYDSVKTLKKIANPHIADGGPIDWLRQMTSRMMKADTGLVGMDKELGTSLVGWQTHLQEIGEEKPQKDLYFAWITSRMSRYTNSIMLKKTLADVGFLGAALPTHASDSLTFGGVRVDTDSLEGDQEGWKEYQEWERKCKEELNEGGGAAVKKAVEDFNELFSPENGGRHPTTDYNVGFPRSCADFANKSQKTYHENLTSIQNQCQRARAGYRLLSEKCNMAVDWNKPCGDGFITRYEPRWVTFEEVCTRDCEKECQNSTDPNCISACEDQKKKDISSEEARAEQLETDLLAEVGAVSDYFPQIVKGEEKQGEIVDEQGAQNVQDTIKSGIYKN